MANLDTIERVLPAHFLRGRRFWRVFRRQRQAVVALVTLAAITAVVPVTARFFAPDPQEMSADVLARPSA
ncbi:MAG TPA: hypothetical protein VMS64_19500, partial [Candidatus Methylomirabilis sp.]|nr:hypothetical protein [Candidatus Methylomirabilis sp.]